MSKEEIKQLTKEEMLKTIKNDLHSEMIFVYVDNLEKENKQLQQKIDKAIEKVKDIWFTLSGDKFYTKVILKDTESGKELLEILGDKE